MSDELRMRAAPGALGMLAHANRSDAGYGVLIGGGDLSQMAAQYQFLLDRGFDVGRRDVYPAVKDDATRIRALRAIWEAQVDGWWNLRRDLVPGVCSETEFRQALERCL